MDQSDKKPKSYYVDYTKRNRYGQRRGGPARGSNTTNNARYKEVPDASFGQRGFLITSIDEVKSYLEMRNVLERYFHEIYDERETSEASKNRLTTEDELESELKQLRFARPFKQVKTHCRNSIFINILPEFIHIDPLTIVARFFDDLAAKKEIMTSNTNRVLPVLDTFRNSVANAKESIVSLFGKLNITEEPKNFFIEFQTRGNYKLESDDKQKMIEGVAETVSQLRPSWKVSREDVDYMIILVALRHVCCLSVVEGYFKRCKYNVVEFCKDFPLKSTEDLDAAEAQE